MTRFALIVLAAAPLLACKADKPSCSPDEVKWDLELLLQASSRANPSRTGEALPTVVRVFQLRGELAIDDLDFDEVWETDDVSKLGESFLSVEELTIFPDKTDVRRLPIEPEATHVVATGLFREPMGSSWYTSYAIPLRHPEVVCAKEPETQEYPNPCFFVLLDGNLLSGGETAPPGFTVDPKLRCAPIGVAPHAAPKKKKKKRPSLRQRRDERLDPDVPRRELDDIERPTAPELPSKSDLPSAPDLPSKSDLPSAPDLPSKSDLPSKADLPSPR